MSDREHLFVVPEPPEGEPEQPAAEQPEPEQAANPGQAPGPDQGPPPPEVARAFGADGEPEPLGPAWDNGWLVGQVALARSVGPLTGWSCRVREKLTVPGLRIARPVRATDGRFQAAGWRASAYTPGERSARVDEAAAAALRLDKALAGQPAPEPVSVDDRFSRAAEAAFAIGPGDPIEPDLGGAVADGLNLDLLGELAAAMRPLTGPNQLCHADLLACVVFRGDEPPTVTDLVAAWHPFGYSAAQVIADGLIVGAVDERIVDRFSFVPELEQLVLRAVAYRIYVDALAERPNPARPAAFRRVVSALLSGGAATL